MQKTIPVALVNGVYFPGQMLRFKVNEPSKAFFSASDKHYGILAK